MFHKILVHPVHSNVDLFKTSHNTIPVLLGAGIAYRIRCKTEHLWFLLGDFNTGATSVWPVC